MAENDPKTADSSMPGLPQTYSNSTFSITTDDDPLSVQQVLDADDERPGVEPEDDEGDDDQEEKKPAPSPPPKKPNGEGQPDQPSAEAKPAKWVRNPDGTFKKNPQHRIQQAVYQQREAERRAEAAEARAKEAEARYRQPPPQPAAQPQPQPQPQPQQPQAPQGFPSYADYLQTHPDATLEVWLDARDTYREDQRQQQIQARQEQDREAAVNQQWQQTIAKARETDPEFEKKLNLDLPISRPMSDIIRNSPIGPQIMLYLSAHPGEAKALAQMPPANVLWAMGNLHGRLSAASSGPAPNGIQPSKATPPIQPVAGSSLAPARNIGADDISFDEHFRSYNAADQKAGRRR